LVRFDGDEGLNQATDKGFLRVDLHVHTRHSVLSAFPVLRARDCYSSPPKVYHIAKSRGMDLVTFTDHDTIDGCLELLSREGDLPDFFISEELTTSDPVTGITLHVGVYGISEGDHREIQALRENYRELAGFLKERRIPSSLNHLGSSLIGRSVDARSLIDLLSCFSLMETLNGAQPRCSNLLAARLSRLMAREGHRQGTTGGSDAHTPARIGTAWTEVEAADRSGCLQALLTGESRAGGTAGSLGSMIRDVYSVVGAYYKDILFDPNRHLEPGERIRAGGCAVGTLPLHLLALPASGTAYRYLRAARTAHRFTRDLALGRQGGRHPVPGIGLIPRPESD
jgi:predicted metal-dependent phosphoesterase TrpH